MAGEIKKLFLFVVTWSRQLLEFCRERGKKAIAGFILRRDKGNKFSIIFLEIFSLRPFENGKIVPEGSF
jgi:hypothetical protein